MLLDKVAVDMLPLLTLRAQDRRQGFDKRRVFLFLTLACSLLAPHFSLGTDPSSGPTQGGVGHHVVSFSSASELRGADSANTHVKALSAHLIMEQDPLLASLLSTAVHWEHQGLTRGCLVELFHVGFKSLASLTFPRLNLQSGASRF